MSRLLVVVASVVLSACSLSGNESAPPRSQFYFPAGIAHVDVPGKTEGALFVANANFDKRYGTGSIDVVDLDAVGLPPLGSATGVQALADLHVEASQTVQIASFAGELGLLPLPNGRYRVYVPTRSEGMRVYQAEAAFDAQGVPTLKCIGGEGQNCTSLGASLSPNAFQRSSTGVPRAPSPYGVVATVRACAATADCCPAEGDCSRSCNAGQCVDANGDPFADVWFTHLSQADSPTQSGTNFRAYLVRLDSDTFAVDEGSFINIGAGGTNSIVARGPWVYASGRVVSPAPNLVRLVRRDGVTLASSLESFFRVADARGLTFSSDGKKIYLVGRIPDTLLVIKLDETNVDAPVLSFVRGVPLPDAPNQVAVIARPGRGDLVAVTATTGGSLALYDEDVGDLVALIPGLGVQPFGLAVDHRGTAARLYVSLFGDGRVAVVDIADLSRPQEARLVAHLGRSQLCLTRGATSPACRALDGGVQ
ncbi:MAG: YncE family protein [Myxococcota bacterium]